LLFIRSSVLYQRIGMKGMSPWRTLNKKAPEHCS
jgi:hypothetical protein